MSPTLKALWTAVLWSAWCSAVMGQSETTLHALPQPRPAPPFHLVDIDGKHHELKDYGGKVVVVNFWATWCPPCRDEMPSMERAYQKLKNEGVVFLGIDVGESEDTVFKFTGDYPVTFPLLLDKDSSVIKSYPVIGLPTTFVVNPKGDMVYRAIGSREWDDPGIIQQLRSLTSQK